MRARLHVRNARIGFFREGTHDLCDVRATRQLLPATVDVLDRLGAAMRSVRLEEVREIELSENIDATDRAIALGASGPVPPAVLEAIAATGGLTGTLVSVPTTRLPRTVAGSAFVTDTPGGIRLTAGHRHDPASLIDARVPLSSSCTADPFTADGANCAPADVNAAFDLFTTAGPPQRLFSQALTEGPNCVLFDKCALDVEVGDDHHHHQQATVIAKLRQRHFVGIIVDKVGKHGVKHIGRVPLGTHARGSLRLKWNLKVNGKRLGAGRYRITLRALDTKGNVLGLTKPVTIRVRG
jgi:hypothetical protein